MERIQLTTKIQDLNILGTLKLGLETASPTPRMLIPTNLLDFKTAVVLFIYFIYTVIYNVYFHPLRNVPGPFLAKISHI